MLESETQGLKEASRRTVRVKRDERGSEVERQPDGYVGADSAELSGSRIGWIIAAVFAVATVLVVSTIVLRSIGGSERNVPIRSVVEALESAETPEDVLALVRDQERLKPKLLAFYAANPQIKLPHRIEISDKKVGLALDGDKAIGRFGGSCDGVPVEFTFESTSDGWRLDWESMIADASRE